MLCRNIANICAAHGDTSAADIPKGCNEFCNRRLAAAGWADQCVDGSLAEGKVDTVQHLGIVVAEVNIMQFHCAALRCFRIRFGAGQRPGGQNVRHLADDRTDLRKIVGELHAADDRRNKTHRKDDNDNEFFRRQRSVFQQQPANGQHAQERRRHNVHGKGEKEVALVHPVYVALRTLLGGRNKLFIAAFRLAEHFNDLDAADVFHRRIVQSVGSRDGAGVILIIARHHEHEENHTERECDE